VRAFLVRTVATYLSTYLHADHEDLDVRVPRAQEGLRPTFDHGLGTTRCGRGPVPPSSYSICASRSGLATDTRVCDSVNFVSDGNGGVLRVCSFTCPGYPDTGVHTGIFLAHESHSGDSQYHVLSTTTSLATFSVF